MTTHDRQRLAHIHDLVSEFYPSLSLPHRKRLVLAYWREYQCWDFKTDEILENLEGLAQYM